MKGIKKRRKGRKGMKRWDEEGRVEKRRVERLLENAKLAKSENKKKKESNRGP